MNDHKDLVILGAGGLGREVLALVTACNAARQQWNIVGFLDPNLNPRSEVDGVRVLGGDEWRQGNSHDSIHYVCAIGDSRLRRQVVEKFASQGCKFASLIHPDVPVPASVRIDAGTVVMAGTRFTADIKVGSHAIIYLNCSITHDVEIGNFCVIACGCSLAGGAVLETGVHLGMNVSVLPRRQVGAWTTIGAGSVVTHDIPANSTAMGVPCRVVTS